jgi:hypothetical protein
MKAEITNENKAKFFALYWMQDVLMCKHYNKPITLIGNHIDYLYCGDYSEYYLQLKPLSSISDEDKEAVGLESYNQFDEKGWYERSTFDELFYYWSFEDADYLRLKGYALPWMGLSVEELVEAGWIKLIE